MLRAAVLVLAALAAAPADVRAQHRADLLPFTTSEAPEGAQTSAEAAAGWGDAAAAAQPAGAELAMGGVLGAAVGLGAGIVVGSLFDGPASRCSDFCFPMGAILGGVVGEVIGAPLGVHLANGRRGDFLPGLGVSAGMLALGIVLGAAMDEPGVILVVPVAQIIGAVSVEQTTARRRALRRSP